MFSILSKRVVCKFILGAAFILPAFGCLPTNLKTVENNTFFSTLSPNTKIKVSDQIRYVGSSKEQSEAGNFDRTEKTSVNIFLFAESDKNSKIIRGLNLITNEINGFGYWKSDIFEGQDLIHESNVKIDGENYRQGIKLAALDSKVLDKNGLVSPTIVMAKVLIKRYGADNKGLLSIVYYEDYDYFSKDYPNISSYNEIIINQWKNGITSDWQRQSIDNFLERSNSAFQLSKVNKNDTPIIFSAVEDSDLIKLTELRKMLDADLISQSEYDKKKKEILDGI